MSDVDTPVAKRAKASTEDKNPGLEMSEGVADDAEAQVDSAASAAPSLHVKGEL